MSLIEIRETLEQELISLDGSGLAIVQKQINLPSNTLHAIQKVDFFQDAFPSYSGTGPIFVELIVTPFPVIPAKNMDFLSALGYGARGPMAGSDTILFKTIVGPYNDVPPYALPAFRQFPNQSVGATPTFSFYTPMVYITALIHADPSSTISNLAYSIYMAVEQSKPNLTSYGLGVLRERSVAQGIVLMNQGRTIQPTRNVGQVFPMWRYGGIRPERMLSGGDARNFWLNYTNTESESMLSSATLRGYVAGARQMAAFDEAFGRDSPTAGPIPDWLRFGLNRGLVSGPILPQMPPVRFADNGNTICL